MTRRRPGSTSRGVSFSTVTDWLISGEDFIRKILLALEMAYYLAACDARIFETSMIAESEEGLPKKNEI